MFLVLSGCLYKQWAIFVTCEMEYNVEIKAKVHNREQLIVLAKELTGMEPIILLQNDVFYNSPNGRMKMRCVIEDGVRKSELIWYDRPNLAGPKPSKYNKLTVPEDIVANLKKSLECSMGVKGEVKKVRSLFIYENTRIHVDDVQGLGHFMELEKTAMYIREKLNVREEDLLTDAYMDMLKAQ
uniref:CYTH domain-containing protein n=1 Tax=Heterorhabditis bacteriophora TaxID=37862 RepID=A0A1I7XU58_HETBA